MPTVKYYTKNTKYEIQQGYDGQPERVRKEYVVCVSAIVKNLKDVEAIKQKRGFLRFRSGNFTIEEIVARAKARGSSEWYV